MSTRCFNCLVELNLLKNWNNMQCHSDLCVVHIAMSECIVKELLRYHHFTNWVESNIQIKTHSKSHERLVEHNQVMIATNLAGTYEKYLRCFVIFRYCEHRIFSTFIYRIVWSSVFACFSYATHIDLTS